MGTHKEKFLELAKTTNRIIITSHVSPDSDAIASCLSMYRWVKNNLPGKEVHIFYENLENADYNYLALYEKIEWVNNLPAKLKGGDMLVLLDGTPLHRFTKYPKEIEAGNYLTYCIDHHEPEENNHNYWITEPLTTSCCELVSRYFYTDKELEEKVAAETLLTGILADTGSFAFVDQRSTSVFIEAKRIVENGKIRIDELQRKISSIKPSEYELAKIFVANSKNVKIREDLPGLTYSYINKTDVENYTESEVSGGYHVFVTRFMRQIESYTWGFVITPTKDENRISFRSSTGAPNVQKIVKEYFDGGGHIMASGGKLSLDAAKDTKEAAGVVLDRIKNAKIEIVPEN